MYTVTIVNEHFSQTGEQESADNAQAWKTAISGAISIAAEIIARQWHGGGRPLSELTGPIHHARLGPDGQTGASAPSSSSSRS